MRFGRRLGNGGVSTWVAPRELPGGGYYRVPAPLAQRQSNGLLIRRFWVQIPGGALEKVQLRGTNKLSEPVYQVAHLL